MDVFDAAATRFLDAVRGVGRIEPEDVKVISTRLARQLQGVRGLTELEAEEAAQDVVLRIIELAEDDGEALAGIRNAGAYLTRLARNRAIDHLRRSARKDISLSDELSATLPSHDDAVAALLDSSASAATVRAAMRRAVEHDEQLTLRVVTTWLDLADELDEAPTSRQVADRVGVSHTSVNQALKRFRSYFPNDPADTS
jgi:RNA polymerase sigma factor (sigma-70 family)